MGDLADDDRGHGMGIVVEYAEQKGKPRGYAPKPFHWNYAHFAKPSATAREPDEVIDMTFTKQNAADHGFNLWAINDKVFTSGAMSATYHLARRQALPPADAQCQRRHSSDPSAPAQF